MLSPLTFLYKLFVLQGKVLSHGAINIVMIISSPVGGWLHGLLLLLAKMKRTVKKDQLPRFLVSQWMLFVIS